jgi:hypothetical protein
VALVSPDRSDLLADLLNGVRATGAAFDRSVVTGPWSMRCDDGSPLALVVPLRGPVWVLPDGGSAARVDPDQVAVLAGGAPYVLTGDPDSAAGSALLRDARCAAPGRPGAGDADGVPPHDADRVPADADASGASVLLTGRYTVDAGAPARLLASLPPLAVVDDVEDDCPISPDALQMLAHPRPGHQVLLDRTLELMLITALRAWLTRPGAEVPAWYAAHSDSGPWRPWPRGCTSRAPRSPSGSPRSSGSRP